MKSGSPPFPCPIYRDVEEAVALFRVMEHADQIGNLNNMQENMFMENLQTLKSLKIKAHQMRTEISRMENARPTSEENDYQRERIEIEKRTQGLMDSIEGIKAEIGELQGKKKRSRDTLMELQQEYKVSEAAQPSPTHLTSYQRLLKVITGITWDEEQPENAIAGTIWKDTEARHFKISTTDGSPVDVADAMWEMIVSS